MSLVLPPWLALGASALFGGIIGSFLNVCIYRMPRDISIVFPPSACPGCGARIAPRDNVPVLAWFWLGGRCRSCRGRISFRYPAVEALTAALFVLAAVRYGFGWELPPALAFIAAMIVVTLVDYDEQIIPDAITLPGIAAGLLASLVTPLGFLESVIGAAVGFGALFAVAWTWKRVRGVEGMGEGDFKLAAMLGAFLGPLGLGVTIFLASLAGSVFGVGLMLSGRAGWRTRLPFGTFLAPAGIVVHLWGRSILGAWFDLLGR